MKWWNLNGVRSTCLTCAFDLVTLEWPWHWQLAVYPAASWKIITLDHSPILQIDLATAEVGTRVRTAFGPFQWSKAFGWKIGM